MLLLWCHLRCEHHLQTIRGGTDTHYPSISLKEQTECTKSITTKYYWAARWIWNHTHKQIEYPTSASAVSSIYIHWSYGQVKSWTCSTFYINLVRKFPRVWPVSSLRTPLWLRLCVFLFFNFVLEQTRRDQYQLHGRDARSFQQGPLNVTSSPEYFLFFFIFCPA